MHKEKYKLKMNDQNSLISFPNIYTKLNKQVQ